MTATVSRPLSKEATDGLKDKFKVQENAKLLAETKASDSEIWSSLPNKARISDLKLQQRQQTVSYGLLTLAKVAEIATKILSVAYGACCVVPR